MLTDALTVPALTRSLDRLSTQAARLPPAVRVRHSSGGRPAALVGDGSYHVPLWFGMRTIRRIVPASNAARPMCAMACTRPESEPTDANDVSRATPISPPVCRNIPRRPDTADVSSGASCRPALFEVGAAKPFPSRDHHADREPRHGVQPERRRQGEPEQTRDDQSRTAQQQRRKPSLRISVALSAIAATIPSAPRDELSPADDRVDAVPHVRVVGHDRRLADGGHAEHKVHQVEDPAVLTARTGSSSIASR